jgi:hypothetical protein
LAGLVLCDDCREARLEELWEFSERECGREWTVRLAAAGVEA